MSGIIYLAILFVAKMLDNMLGTAKIILVQHNKCALAGIALALSNFIYFYITKCIVESNGMLSIIIVSIASGVGCCIAIVFSNKFSKDKTYVNILLSDNVDEMMALRDFLAVNKITNVVSDSYDRDWKKVLSITAYPETKDQSRLIDEYMANSDVKFKRLVQNKRVK